MIDQDGSSEAERVPAIRLSTQDLGKLKQFFGQLDEREKDIFKLWFGLGDGYPYDCSQIAEIFSTTPNAVDFTVEKLRRALKANSLEQILYWCYVPRT